MAIRKDLVAELQALAQANDDQFSAEQVLDWARSHPASAMHAHFDERGAFDPDKAQFFHGLTVARELIRSVKVLITTTSYSVRCPVYVRDPEKPADQQGYTSISRLRTDEDNAREAAVNEFVRAAAALARAKAIADALGLGAEIDELRARIERIINDVETHHAPGVA